MISALVNLATSQVENLIMADPAVDQTLEGYALIPEPPAFVEIGSVYPFVAPLGSVAEDGML